MEGEKAVSILLKGGGNRMTIWKKRKDLQCEKMKRKQIIRVNMARGHYML